MNRPSTFIKCKGMDGGISYRGSFEGQKWVAVGILHLPQPAGNTSEQPAAQSAPFL